MNKEKPFTDHIIGLENLRQPERAELDRIIAAIRSTSPDSLPGVLVGAMRGAEIWDIRPVMLQHVPKKGTLAVLRVSNPSFKSAATELEKFKKLHGGVWYLNCGLVDSQLWIRRIFYPVTLASPGTSLKTPSRFARKLIEALKQLHELEIVHGHVCAENIAVENEDAIFLDSGMRSLGQKRQTSDDVFDLAEVLKKLMGSQLSDEQKNVLSLMQSEKVSERPDLKAIEHAFLPAFATEAGRILVGAEPGQVRSGKLLGQGTVVSTPQAPKAEERSYEKKPEPVSAPEISAIPIANEEVRQELEKKSQSIWLYIALPVMLIAAYLYWSQQSGRQEKYKNLWYSENAQDVKVVAEAAVLQNDSGAQSVIIDDAFSAKPKPGYRASLIRMAFRPLWRKALDKEDRDIAMSLALSQLSQSIPENLPPLANAHPGVIVAVIGDLGLKASEGKFSDIPLAVLTKLPQPYGLAFSELEKLKVQNMGELSARALSRIVSGNTTPETLEAWLSGTDEGAQANTRFLIVLSFADQLPDLVQALSESVRTREDALGARFVWFQQEKLAGWENISLKDKLYLVGGLLPEISLNFEQLSDLLLFPAPTVQNAAQNSLKKGLISQKEAGTLEVLASKGNELSRFQTVSLLVALKMPEDEAYPLISRWFETNPHPESVLKLLLARKGAPVNDPWNLEAARYLSSNDFEATLDELSSLAVHPEALARALAYSRLDPNDPAQAKILKAGAKREPSEKMREVILKKLQEAGSTN